MNWYVLLQALREEAGTAQCEGGQCEQRQQLEVLPPEREGQSLPLNHRG